MKFHNTSTMIQQKIRQRLLPLPSVTLPGLELHHTCTVDPVLMDPQPVGVAWLTYECPDCGEIAT